jgi:hypothetical protein
LERRCDAQAAPRAVRIARARVARRAVLPRRADGLVRIRMRRAPTQRDAHTPNARHAAPVSVTELERSDAGARIADRRRRPTDTRRLALQPRLTAAGHGRGPAAIGRARLTKPGLVAAVTVDALVPEPACPTVPRIARWRSGADTTHALSGRSACRARSACLTNADDRRAAPSPHTLVPRAGLAVGTRRASSAAQWRRPAHRGAALRRQCVEVPVRARKSVLREVRRKTDHARRAREPIDALLCEHRVHRHVATGDRARRAPVTTSAPRHHVVEPRRSHVRVRTSKGVGALGGDEARVECRCWRHVRVDAGLRSAVCRRARYGERERKHRSQRNAHEISMRGRPDGVSRDVPAAPAHRRKHSIGEEPTRAYRGSARASPRTVTKLRSGFVDGRVADATVEKEDDLKR